VLVVAYHSGKVLNRSLAAVEAFAPEGSLVIVIDNSPEDLSAAQAVASFAEGRLLSEPTNVGFAAAVNDGLALSTAEIILLVNPDISSVTGSFDEVRDLFDRNAAVGAVAVHLVDADGRLQHCRRRFRRFDLFAQAVGVRWLPRRWQRRWTNPMHEWDHSEERMIENATGALLFLRRAAVDDVGPLDEQFFMYWEETDWLERARAKGWELVFTPAVRGVHAVRQSSDAADARHSLLLLESTHKYARKHFGRGTAVALRLAWVAADLVRLLTAAGRPAEYRRQALERLQLHLGLIADRKPVPRER
jgi:N-acetylglucosaminyl-diphospho-decaprenol L-rhamnosyltransferase